MIRKLFMPVLLALASIAPAEELYRIDYTAHAEAPGNGFTVRRHYMPHGYDYMPATDGTVPGRPLQIYSPSIWSWIYAVGDVPAERLGGAKNIKLVAYLMTNRPKDVKITVTEGASFDGGNASYIKSVTAGMSGEAFTWQRVEVDFERTTVDSMVSFAVGTGGSAGLWVAVDRLIVTVDEPGNEAAPIYSIMLNAGDSFNEFHPHLVELPPVLRAKAAATVEPEVKAVIATDSALLAEAIAALEARGDIGSDLLKHSGRIIDLYRKHLLTLEVDNSLRVFAEDSILPFAPVGDFELYMPQNASDGVLYLLRNNAGNSRDFMLKFSGGGVASTLYVLEKIDGAADYPRPIANGDAIHLGKGETRGVLVQFNTKGVDAGSHKFVFEVIPFYDKLEVSKSTITLNVAPLELPDTMPIRIFHWDYTKANQPEFLEKMIENRVNVFHIYHLPPPDAESLDFVDLRNAVAAIRKAAPDLDFSLLVEAAFVPRNGGWKPEYNRWLDKLCEELAALGIDYDRWWLETFDENLGEAFHATAKAIKDHNPRVRNFSDRLESDTTVVESFLDRLDVWCPGVTQFYPLHYENDAKAMEIIRASSAECWTYSCSPLPTQPLAELRYQPWVARVHNLDGCCVWTYYVVNQRPPSTPTWNHGLFYRNSDGSLTPARRMFQWRAGLEDYLIMDWALAQDDPAITALAVEFQAEVVKAMEFDSKERVIYNYSGRAQPENSNRLGKVVIKYRTELLKHAMK